MQTQDSTNANAPQTGLFPLSPECVRQLLEIQEAQEDRVFPAHPHLADDF